MGYLSPIMPILEMLVNVTETTEQLQHINFILNLMLEPMGVGEGLLDPHFPFSFCNNYR